MASIALQFFPDVCDEVFRAFFKKGAVPKTLLQSRCGNVFSLLLCELLADGLLSRSTSTFCWWSTSSPESENLWAHIMWRPNACLPKNALSHNEHLTAVDLLLLEHDVALRLFDGTLLISVEFGCLCCFVMCSQCTIRLEGFRASYECTRRVGILLFAADTAFCGSFWRRKCRIRVRLKTPHTIQRKATGDWTTMLYHVCIGITQRRAVLVALPPRCSIYWHMHSCIYQRSLEPDSTSRNSNSDFPLVMVPLDCSATPL